MVVYTLVLKFHSNAWWQIGLVSFNWCFSVPWQNIKGPPFSSQLDGKYVVSVTSGFVLKCYYLLSKQITPQHTDMYYDNHFYKPLILLFDLDHRQNALTSWAVLWIWRYPKRGSEKLKQELNEIIKWTTC